MRKVPKALVLGILLITAAVFADWQAELWKGGIWSDGSNLTVTGTVTAPSGFIGNTTGTLIGNVTGDLTGDVTADIIQVGTLQTVGHGVHNTTMGTAVAVTVPGTLPGDRAQATIQAAGSTAAYITQAVSTTNTVTLTLSASPVTTPTLFVQVYRIVD